MRAAARARPGGGHRGTVPPHVPPAPARLLAPAPAPGAGAGAAGAVAACAGFCGTFRHGRRCYRTRPFQHLRQRAFPSTSSRRKEQRSRWSFGSLPSTGGDVDTRSEGAASVAAPTVAPAEATGKAASAVPLEGPELDGQILALALPALVALCAEPALSIIDTGYVGRLPEPALSLAGLGVATSIFDFIFRCYNFLCVVTVPLVAKAIVAKRRGDPTAEEPAEITGRVIGLAAFLGVVTWLSLLAGAPAAVQLAGAEPTSALGGIAEGYLRIRAAALPASLVNTVAIGAFRGQLDTTTPLYVVLAETLVNVVLAAVFVFGYEPLGVPAMGVEGSALATALAIWLACGAYCFVLSRRGLIAWEAALTWPVTLTEMQPLIVGSLSQLLRTLSLQAVLLQFTRIVVALDVGGLAAAAHQVALRTWFFALFALDSIAVAAQGMLPTVMADEGRESARRVAWRLLCWGCGGGILTGVALAWGAEGIPAIFTDAADVQATARPLILVVAALQPLAGLVFTWDGIFQGLADYSYLAVAMAISAAVTIGALQLDVLSGSLQGVWTCFALLILCRAAGLAWRFWGPGPLSEEPAEQ